jgi:hypothetical protein
MSPRLRGEGELRGGGERRRRGRRKRGQGDDVERLRPRGLGTGEQRAPRSRDLADPVLVLGVEVDRCVLGRNCPTTGEVGQALTDKTQCVLRHRPDSQTWCAQACREPIGFAAADGEGPADEFTREGEVRGSDEREVVRGGEEEQAGVVRMGADDQPLQTDVLSGVEDVQVARCRHFTSGSLNRLSR